MTLAEQEHMTRGIKQIGSRQDAAIYALENQSCTGATRIARTNLKKAQHETLHLIGYLELCKDIISTKGSK